MAALVHGASSSEGESDDNDLLLRLQTLFLECVHTALANYFDQTLAAENTTLAGKKNDIYNLYLQEEITKSQFNLLSGDVSTSDLDITLIICLITHLKCFPPKNKNKIKKLWNILLKKKSYTSFEADICRLDFFWKEIFHHQSSIEQNEFTRMWEETEAILLRINEVYPIANFKHTITDIRNRSNKSFKQRRLRQTFSDRLFLLDPNDAYIYNEALKKGSGKDRFVRINVVGNYGQGKTSLTRRLLNQSLEGVESTDGIDVHVRKCKIKGKEWESSQSEKFDENYCLENLVEGTNRMKTIENKTDKSDHTESKKRRKSMPSEGYTEEPVTGVFSNKKSIADDPLSTKSEASNDPPSTESEASNNSPSTESEASRSSFTTGENTCSEAHTQASFIGKYSSQLRDKMDKPLDEKLTANIWDFGGQFIYYATHQIFHSRDAIYLLVFSLAKDLNEAVIDTDFPDRKWSMGDCLKFWLNSIHTHTGSEENSVTPENVSNTTNKIKKEMQRSINANPIRPSNKDQRERAQKDPKQKQDRAKPNVILVGTFKDKFEGDSEKKFDEVLDLFVNDSARSHLLPEQYAVSNINMSDDEVRKLKGKIFELGRNHAERNQVPLKWIPLEIALLLEKSKNIIKFDEVKDLNFKNENLVEEEELKTFLKYLHLKGSLIFFDEENIEGYIVVNPQYLVNAFRCVIGSKSCIKDAQLHPLWNRMNETAILENELLDAMWKKEAEKDFAKNKEVLLMFLQRHMILSKLNIMDEEGNMDYQEKYMIPSLLKHSCDQQELKMFTDGKCTTLVSLGLRIENTALLTSLYERITAGILGKWSPFVLKKRVFVFRNVGYFRLDLEHVGKVELKPGKGIQLTVINQCPGIKVGSKVSDYFRRYVEGLIKHDFHKRKRSMYNSSTYTHYLACCDSSHDGNESENTYDIDEVRTKERAPCPDLKAHAIDCKSAIDEWFLPGKTTDLYAITNRRVTKMELGMFARCIGHNWRLLGIALGVRPVDLDHLEMDYRCEVATCIYKMLCKWEQIKQDDATLLQLITCIEGNQAVNVDWDMIKNIIEGN